MDFIDCSIYGVVEKEQSSGEFLRFIVTDIYKTAEELKAFLKLNKHCLVEKLEEGHIVPELLLKSNQTIADFIFEENFKVVNAIIKTKTGKRLAKTVVDFEDRDIVQDIHTLYQNINIVQLTDFF
ncbi:hypothetical protein ACTNBL_01290 [Enterococcus villorum]|uniref:Uncharacterized protein n=2 Tax=Enterococcus villorum TaxID=112904 RepID=A0A511J3F2_9ENTE|nr:hypothetical protein [Enterococcus villorum]EOH91993.1 hypothetical protein UAO_00664 [Enterococcus villorum ATCC 700913]EOW76709.1 hypothetical protein I591_02017 [Enterococcus villorum ATCC 700913]GEL92515.1 hypothetical protein EVI01_18520 [Enterococcus villorum]